MSLCQLTQVDGNQIWINPNIVISVQADGERGTIISTTGTRDGKPHRIYVSESANHVASRLDIHGQ